MLTFEQIEQITARYEKARNIVDNVYTVYDNNPNGRLYAVLSSRGEVAYIVSITNKPICNCPDFKENQESLVWCKHSMAAAIYERQHSQDGHKEEKPVTQEEIDVLY